MNQCEAILKRIKELEKELSKQPRIKWTDHKGEKHYTSFYAMSRLLYEFFPDISKGPLSSDQCPIKSVDLDLTFSQAERLFLDVFLTWMGFSGDLNVNR